MRDELRRLALFTSGVAELTAHRAEQIVKQWVGSGELRRDQATGMVKALLDMSKQSRQELLRLIRSEIQTQVEGLGLATKRDVERLERKVTRLEQRQPAAATKRSTGARKTASKNAKKSAGKPRPGATEGG